MRDSINATLNATPDDLEQWLKSYRLSKHPDDEPGIWSTHGRVSYHSPEYGTITFEIKVPKPGELLLISVEYEKNNKSLIYVDNLINAILNRFGESPLPNDLPTISESKLRDQLVEYFNISEIKNLCHDLGIEYENLEGETRNDKARELIKYCHRHGKFEELITTCKKRRPHVNWEIRDKKREFGAFSTDKFSSAVKVLSSPQRRRIIGFAVIVLLVASIIVGTSGVWETIVNTFRTADSGCNVEISGILLEKNTVEIGSIIDVAVNVQNPDNVAIKYDWTANYGEMNPGIGSISPQSQYKAPPNPISDSISVSVQVQNCSNLKSTEQISVVYPASNTLVPDVEITNSPPPATPMSTIVTDLSRRVLIAVQDINIRSGPGITFENVDVLLEGQSAIVLDQANNPVYWKIECPNSEMIEECWVSGGNEYVNIFEIGDIEDNEVIRCTVDIETAQNDYELGKAHYCRGFAYDQIGENLRAINDYSIVIQLSETVELGSYASLALVERGLLYANVLSDCERAIPDLERYLEGTHSQFASAA